MMFGTDNSLINQFSQFVDNILVALKIKDTSTDMDIFVRTASSRVYNKVFDYTGEYGVRINTLVRLRWLAICGQLLTILIVRFLYEFSLPLILVISIIAFTAITNILLSLYKVQSYILGVSNVFIVCIYDLLQLATLLYLTGGIHNPFIFLIIAPLVISASVLPLRYIIIQGLLAILCVCFLIYFHLPLPWIEGIEYKQDAIYILGIWSSLIICLVFIGFYTWRISYDSNQMSEALLSLELMQSELVQLKALDGLAAAIAHELGSPLSTIAIIVKEMKDSIHNQQDLVNLENDIDTLQSQNERCRHILRQLSSISDEKDEYPPINYVSLDYIIKQAISVLPDIKKQIDVIIEPLKNGQNLVYWFKSFDEPKIPNNPSIIYALGNFISNSNYYANERITICANWDNENIIIKISDDGLGFSHKISKDLGEPFKTTRTDKSQLGENDIDKNITGLGLGIFVSKIILERLGAIIKIGNKKKPEHGAIIEISWNRIILEKGL